MKYLWLVPKDQRVNNWVLYNENNNTGVSLRTRYADLVCSSSNTDKSCDGADFEWGVESEADILDFLCGDTSCNKLDEITALKRGIDEDVIIKSQSDYLSSDDGFILISKKLWEVCESHKIRGFKPIPIPGDNNYLLVLPENEVETDRSSSHVEFLNQCKNCGRYKETLYFPFYSSMDLSNQPNKIECSNISMENSHGRQFWFLAPEPIVKIWRENNISGVEYDEWQ